MAEKVKEKRGKIERVGMGGREGGWREGGTEEGREGGRDGEGAT